MSSKALATICVLLVLEIVSRVFYITLFNLAFLFNSVKAIICGDFLLHCSICDEPIGWFTKTVERKNEKAHPECVLAKGDSICKP